MAPRTAGARFTLEIFIHNNAIEQEGKGDDNEHRYGDSALFQVLSLLFRQLPIKPAFGLSHPLRKYHLFGRPKEKGGKDNG
jgi:hypothetical protein